MSTTTSTMGRESGQDALAVIGSQADPEASREGQKLPQAAPEPSAARLILTLGVAGLVSGLSLVLVYIATGPAIERNRIAAIEAAVLQVLPGAESFRILVERDGEVTRHDGEGVPSGPVVYAGFGADGEAVGFAIPGEGPGWGDTLEILIGWDAARRRVVGMAVLESRETPGLGDKIITDEAFTSSFHDLSLDPEAVLVDPGQRSAGNEVDGISGATVSAQAIVGIVNDSVSVWDERLPDQATLRASTENAGSQAEEQTDDGRPAR